MNTGKGFVNRDYRSLHETSNLRYFKITIKETDLAIGVDQESYTDSLVSVCRKEIIKLRGDLEDYISLHKEFRTSFFPLELLPAAPEIARVMASAAAKAGVGPMAAVAGAIAEAVGKKLDKYVNEIIVENGGDIYIKSNQERIVSVFAGQSKFSNRIGLKIHPEESPLGICTSSGTVGPSISLGKADAMVIKGKSAALADAVASAAGNRVQNADDLIKAIELVQNISGITGVLAIKGDKMAAWGSVEIVPLKIR
ncbi:MAG: UPF0280 family protein [Syntrophomonadaceae bacterium]|jgi:ApbE superfamily uncharacterized protein (UPF0280 family)